MKLKFAFCLVCAICLPVIWPQMRLFFFAPFIVFCFYQYSFQKTAWIALGSGLIIDLLSTSMPFGRNALVYTLCALLLYHKKQRFFEDSPSTLAFMTFFFSFLAALFFWLLGDAPLSRRDFFEMPLADASFAFICFNLPWLLWGPKTRRGQDYFLQRSR